MLPSSPWRQCAGRPPPPPLPPLAASGEALALRRSAGWLLRRQADAATLLGPDASRLVGGIELVGLTGPPGGPFGPTWPGHPLASPAMKLVHRMREPDVTRELASLMGPAAGPRGPERAVSFLRVLADLARKPALHAALEGRVRPAVTAELPVGPVSARAVVGERALTPSARKVSNPRIDLLFEWPLGGAGQQAVVVVEAKLGAIVTAAQLLPYGREAAKRARGGPVTRILLTVQADAAERRYRSWSPVRWFALMRRWEGAIAAAGDSDPGFAAVRAHVWRFLLDGKGYLR